MNEPTSFVDLVKTMRAAQKKYFSSHTQTDLQRAKFLERQVDVQVEKLSKPVPEAEQMALPAENEAAQ